MTREQMIARILSTPAHTDLAHAMQDATKVQRNESSVRDGIARVRLASALQAK